MSSAGPLACWLVRFGFLLFWTGKGIATPTHKKTLVNSDELYSLRSYMKHAMFSTIIKAYFNVKINTLQIQVNIFVVCEHWTHK